MDCSCAPILRFSLWRQMAPQQSAKFITAFLVNFVPVLGTIASSIMNRFGLCFRNLLEGKMYLATWCLFLPAGCREAANFRYCFYSQAKNQVFRPAGATRCTYSGQTLQYDGHLCPLGGAKFHINRRMRPPKYQKFPLFGKESPHRGDSVDRFPKFLGAFIRLTILR